MALIGWNDKFDDDISRKKKQLNFLNAISDSQLVTTLHVMYVRK
jgi:hypothetical protein